MAEKKRYPWDMGRLWQTLNYFEIIPFIGCLKSIFGQKKQEKNQSMDIILVVGAMEEFGQAIVRHIISNNYQVRVLVNDIDKAKTIYGDKVAIYGHEITSQLINNVSSIIYISNTADIDIHKLVETAKSNVLPVGEKLLFDFQNPSQDIKEIWGAVDDVVMGGVSASSFRLIRNQGVFSGNVSTANNGGFASVRSRNLTPPWDLSDYQGIQLRIQGDGKRYKFISRCEGKWDGIGYCYSFDTVHNYWTTIRIPFTELIPVFRAKTVAEAGSFDASKVYSMQLMLSKFEYDGGLNPKFDPGFFALEVASIKAYGGSKSMPQFILVNSTVTEQEVLRQSGLIYTMITPAKSTPEQMASFCLEKLI